MTVDGADVRQILEYRSATAIARLLPTGLLLIFLGLCIFALADTDREPMTLVGVILCWVAGIAVIATALWRRTNPGAPLFTLSPSGIHYRIPWVKEFLIPWHEIQGVDTIDVVAGYWSVLWTTRVPIPRYRTMVFRTVTVITVSKEFYDQTIHVDSVFLRGPGWNANFMSKGPLVQVALHHELVSVEPQGLRAAVEARWRAFRDQAAAAPVRSSVPSVTASGIADAPRRVAAYATPKSNVVAMGDDAKAIVGWDALKITVLLIGIAGAAANLAGVWDLPGQSKAREGRAKAREERKYWEDAAKRREAEQKQRDAEDKARRRQFDDDMRRAFGR
jgi:hypothetical protein